MVHVLKRTLGRHRPLALYGGVEQYAFPSGHATVSAVVLASLAFLLARGQSLRWRLGIGATAAVYVALVGFSRLYLGAHWLSDVVGGFSFGLAAVALSAMVYTQHRVQEPVRPRRLALASGATLVIAGTLWHGWHGPADTERYAPAPQRPLATTLQAWTDGGFRQLPAWRQEFAGEREERFTLQVACAQPRLLEALQRAGWVPAPGLGIASVLQAIAPHPAVDRLPVLPQYDGGRPSSLELLHVGAAEADARSVLRLWKSDWELPCGVPVWYGSFAREVQVRPDFGFLRQEPQAAGMYAASLRSAGLRRADGPAPAADAAPELWICPPSS
jgi:hypothetical protein